MSTIDPTQVGSSPWLPKVPVMIDPVDAVSFKEMWHSEVQKGDAASSGSSSGSAKDRDSKSGELDAPKDPKAVALPMTFFVRFPSIDAPTLGVNVSSRSLMRWVEIQLIQSAQEARKTPSSEFRFISKGDVAIELRIRVEAGRPVLEVVGSSETLGLLKDHVAAITQILRQNFKAEPLGVSFIEEASMSQGQSESSRQDHPHNEREGEWVEDV